MSRTYQHVLEKAMSLPRKERFALVEAILSQIKGEMVDDEPMSNLKAEEDTLFRELDLRMEEILSGKVKAIPGEKVMAKLKSRID